MVFVDNALNTTLHAPTSLPLYPAADICHPDSFYSYSRIVLRPMLLYCCLSVRYVVNTIALVHYCSIYIMYRVNIFTKCLPCFNFCLSFVRVFDRFVTLASPSGKSTRSRYQKMQWKLQHKLQHKLPGLRGV